MPPESVPELLLIRLLAISRLCPQPWTKMPPPPWELLVMPNPSMLDGLQEKLLGNGFGETLHIAPLGFAWVFCRSGVPVGNPASKVGSYGFDRKFTPLPSTVMPAPSSAPIKDGSCSCSARLPLSSASHPTVASSGKRSTCALKLVVL